MSIIKKTEILLEAGTNEMEMMEFKIADCSFGINVAKVREILKIAPVIPMQNVHPVIEGIFKPRDNVITVIDLAKYLGLQPSEDSSRDIFMITEFNNQVAAFHVHSVVGINRISWEQIQKPGDLVYGGTDGSATGIVDYDGRLIAILDFEKIIAEISPRASIQIGDVTPDANEVNGSMPILLAEDSILLSRAILDCLDKAGFKNVFKVDNGQEAYDYLLAAKREGGNILDHIRCIITDLEMPQMDGHRLTRLVKSDDVLKEIPVIIFSSIINEEMAQKGNGLGADAQITKPQIANLVEVISRLTGNL